MIRWVCLSGTNGGLGCINLTSASVTRLDDSDR